MSCDIHAWVEIVPVDWYRPTHAHAVIICTEGGEIGMASYTGDGGDGAMGYWIQAGSGKIINGLSVTHWADTHKFNQAIEKYNEEHRDEDQV